MQLICDFVSIWHAPLSLLFTSESIVMDHSIVMGQILEFLQPSGRQSVQLVADHIHSTTEKIDSISNYAHF